MEKHKQAHVKGETIHRYVFLIVCLPRLIHFVYFRCETCKKTFKGPTYLKNHYLTKFHLRRMTQIMRSDFQDDEMTEISDEDIDFDLPDSMIEELDE